MNKGDIVQLKSGGPKMTFGYMTNDDFAICYYTKNGEICCVKLYKKAIKLLLDEATNDN